MTTRERINTDGVAHARKLGAEGWVLADLGGVGNAELVEELLEDGELGLEGFEVLGAQRGAVATVCLVDLGVCEGGEADAPAGRGHGESFGEES